MGAIKISSNFSTGAHDPLDCRTVVKTHEELLAIEVLFDGLECWVKEEGTKYRCRESEDNTYTWEKLSNDSYLPISEDLDNDESPIGTMKEYVGEDTPKYTRGYHYMRTKKTETTTKYYITLSGNKYYQQQTGTAQLYSSEQVNSNGNVIYYIGTPKVGQMILLGTKNKNITFSLSKIIAVTTVIVIEGGDFYKLNGYLTTTLYNKFVNDSAATSYCWVGTYPNSSFSPINYITDGSDIIEYGTAFPQEESETQTIISWERYNTQPGTSDMTDYHALIAARVAIAQGSDNANKVLMTDSDGNVTTETSLYNGTADYSTRLGYGTRALGAYQTVIGRFNEKDSDGNYILILGNGTSDTDRSNAVTIDFNGNIVCNKVTQRSASETVNSFVLDYGANAEVITYVNARTTEMKLKTLLTNNIDTLTLVTASTSTVLTTDNINTITIPSNTSVKFAITRTTDSSEANCGITYAY